jgi:hypothetical protein
MIDMRRTMQGFYWLIEDALAGCARPGGGATRRGGALEDDGMLAALDADLAWLREQGIGAVLSMTETPLAAAALERHDLESLHLPVDDLTAPTPEQFDRALRFIDWLRISCGWARPRRRLWRGCGQYAPARWASQNRSARSMPSQFAATGSSDAVRAGDRIPVGQIDAE